MLCFLMAETTNKTQNELSKKDHRFKFYPPKFPYASTVEIKNRIRTSRREMVVHQPQEPLYPESRFQSGWQKRPRSRDHKSPKMTAKWNLNILSRYYYHHYVFVYGLNFIKYRFYYHSRGLVCISERRRFFLHPIYICVSYCWLTLATSIDLDF